MRKNRTVYSLVIGSFFTLLTAGLLFLVAQGRVASEVNQVLMIIAGMTTVAAFTACQQPVENRTSSSSLHISFNEVLVSRGLSEGPMTHGSSPVDREKVEEPWDLSIEGLVGLDNSLALAKLRMELEKELRRIAYNSQLAIRSQTVIGLARELVSREILPATWRGPLYEITRVCNEAIHGGTQIPDDTADSVVRVGVQLLEQLRSVRNNGGTS